MEGNLGVVFKQRKKEEAKAPVFLTCLIAIILIITYSYTLKMYEPATNLILTGGILVYPISFLANIFMTKNYGLKAARKSIFTAAAIFVIFILLIMFCAVFEANKTTAAHDAMLQYVFVNDVFYIGKIAVYYPTLGQFFGVLISFLASHILYSTIYSALAKVKTNEYLSMGLSLFIAYIVDRIIFIPLLYSEGLIKGSNTFDYLVKCLISEFMAAMFASVLVIIAFTIINNLKNKFKKAN